jgi:hypothetical protein
VTATVEHLPTGKIDTFVWACAPLRSLAAAEVHDRGRRSQRRGEEGRGEDAQAVMRVCGRIAILLYASRDSLVVIVAVSADGFLNIGGRRRVSC